MGGALPQQLHCTQAVRRQAAAHTVQLVRAAPQQAAAARIENWQKHSCDVGIILCLSTTLSPRVAATCKVAANAQTVEVAYALAGMLALWCSVL